jgi:hypothetical protein
MRFYEINTMPMDTAFAFTADGPAGFRRSYKLSEGEEVCERDEYPKDAHVQMDDRFGRELGGLVGNTRSLLIVNRAIKEAVEQANTKAVQILPVAIFNHKARIESADFFIINPIGVRDCVDLAKSEIEFHDGEVVKVKKLVLSADKLEDAPDIFRVKESPSTYVASEKLVDAWIALDPRPKNVYVVELAVTPTKSGARPS